MPDYVVVRDADGEPIPFEVDELDGQVPAGRRWDATAEQASETLDRGVDRIKQVASTVIAKLANMADAPDKVTVEVGLKVTASFGVVVAKSAAEAHIKIGMEWSRAESG